MIVRKMMMYVIYNQQTVMNVVWSILFCSFLISLTKLVPLLTFQEPRSLSKDSAPLNMPSYNRNRCEDYYNENWMMPMMYDSEKDDHVCHYNQQTIMNVVWSILFCSLLISLTKSVPLLTFQEPMSWLNDVA